MSALVSVIIPIYKVEKYLDQCLKSIVNQTYRNLEIILIDDGSPDKCPEMCDAWSKRDERITVVHQKNCGLSAARNKGIEVAGGDYLYFVDSDDYVDENLVEKAVVAIEKSGADIVVFGVYRISEKGEIIESTESIEEKTAGSREALIDLANKKIHDYAWNKLYKRKAFENVRFPVGRVFEDIATTYKTFLNADSVYYLPDELYYYRRRKDGIVGSMKSSSLCDLFELRKMKYDKLNFICPEAAQACFDLTASSALSFFDSSLWNKVNADSLMSATEFLAKNRKRAMEIGGDMKFYLCLPKVYIVYRKAKHYIGNVVKSLRKLLKK